MIFLTDHMIATPYEVCVFRWYSVCRFFYIFVCLCTICFPGSTQPASGDEWVGGSPVNKETVCDRESPESSHSLLNWLLYKSGQNQTDQITNSNRQTHEPHPKCSIYPKDCRINPKLLTRLPVRKGNPWWIW